MLFSSLIPGTVANFLVELQLSPSLPTKWDTVLTIAQGLYSSYPVTLQVQGSAGQ